MFTLITGANCLRWSALKTPCLSGEHTWSRTVVGYGSGRLLRSRRRLYFDLSRTAVLVLTQSPSPVVGGRLLSGPALHCWRHYCNLQIKLLVKKNLLVYVKSKDKMILILKVLEKEQIEILPNFGLNVDSPSEIQTYILSYPQNTFVQNIINKKHKVSSL